MKAATHWRAWLAMPLALCAGFNAAAQPTNGVERVPTRVEPASRSFDQSAFRIVSERNIFNANRSGGGQVRGPSRRPSSVEFFSLVGTMEYQKGTFAFFEGSSSQFTKVMKADEVIAGHKLLGISPEGVKLQADGKEIELPVGSQMRREDEGAWQVAETRGGPSLAANSSNSRRDDRNGRTDRGDSSPRSRRESDSSSGRTDNSEPSNRPTPSTAPTSGNEDEVLKRLMERREKESQ